MSTAYSSAKQKYIGNGVTTEWGFDFPIQKHSELKVYLKRSSLPQVLLEEGVDYSFVTENTIAFPIKTGESKLQATDVLALQRESVFESEYNFSNQQRLEPEEVMHADDNLERQIQELKRDSESAIKVQPTSNINTDEYFIAVESIYENLDNITNVSGISAEIVNCSDNISDISTVSSNISNVNAVGQSISNVNTVASNVSSVNTVAGVSTDVTTVSGISTDVSTVAVNDANVTTVATNISDVNTAATNIEAIKEATTSATNAAQSATNAANSATDSANSATASANSANNSHIWAEGTDAQVQALGGVHSSKVWAEQSTNANIALTNTPYTTNRILEIPQDIKLELNDGTLTLKAGSKVYVPNRFEADGTTPKFDVVNVQSDISLQSYNGTYTECVVLQSGTLLNSSNVTKCFSGNSAPSFTGSGVWYDTANNVCKRSGDGGSTWETCSFPLCLCNVVSALRTSIDQVFNGFGYIGSTVFALPGVKVQYPNGRNEDGTCNSGIIVNSKVNLYHATGTDYVDIVLLQNSIFAYTKTNLFYDSEKNLVKHKNGSIIYGTTIASCWNKNRVVSDFLRYDVDSVVNSNASNFSQAGRSYLSGLGMPSDRYIDLTLGASGSTYTAPANGWFRLVKKPTATGQYILFSQVKYYNGQKNSDMVAIQVSSWTEPMVITIPMLKGDKIYCYYNFGGETIKFEFRYAEGEN